MQTYSPEEAVAMQQKIMKFHLGRLKFKKTEKEGVEGVDLDSRATIAGLIAHFDLAVQYTMLNMSQELWPVASQFSQALAKMPKDSIPRDLTVAFGKFSELLNNYTNYAQDNLVLLIKELDSMGWSDEML